MAFFEAGVAVREFTPAPGFPLWGYFDRERLAIGTLDPLFVKACAFRTPNALAVIVVYDLGRVPVDTVLNQIRDRVSATASLFFSATHTHHAPVMEWAEAPYMAAIVEASVECIHEAIAKLEPVNVGIGHAEIDIAHNRRVLTNDGRCRMLRRNEARIPTSPVDREATIVTLTNAAGRLVATLVHFACHPVVMGPSNMQYSADYVGEMTREIKDATGAECLFLQGACGNINPYLAKTPVTEGAVNTMHAVGSTCAMAVIAALPGIVPEAPVTPSIEFLIRQVPVGVRWDLQNKTNMAVLRATHGPLFQYYFDHVHAGLCVPLTVLLLNRELAFVGAPGEMFIQYQLALKTDVPVRHALLCGYTNEYYAYFPTVRDAAAGGYGGTVASFVGLGAGDRLLTEAEIVLGMMSGALKPECAPETFLLFESESASLSQ